MIDYELNTKIKRLAPKHIVSDIAPDTFSKLMNHSSPSLVVWAGASDKTIYGDPSVNWAMRAWHDSLHIKLNADFTPEGEKLVAIAQASMLPGYMGEIIMAEVAGQVEYFTKHGNFPVDQLEFVLSYLRGNIL